MERNGKISIRKMTKTYKCQVSYADCIKKGELSVQYRPTLDMIADYCTKWLQGSLFWKLRDLTLGNLSFPVTLRSTRDDIYLFGERRTEQRKRGRRKRTELNSVWIG